EAREYVQSVSLATARRTQQRHELALLHLERQTIDGAVRAEMLGQLLKDEEAHARPHAPRWSQRSTSRFQRLVQSSRWALIVSQSGVISLAARSPTGAILPSSG